MKKEIKQLYILNRKIRVQRNLYPIFIGEKVEKVERLNMVKGILDAIDIYIKLTDEKVDYKLYATHSGNSLYCKYVQNTFWKKKIEYELEYSILGNFLVLEIQFPSKGSGSIKNTIDRDLQHNCNPQVNILKESTIYRYMYKFEDICMVNSIAEIMINLSKAKNI